MPTNSVQPNSVRRLADLLLLLCFAILASLPMLAGFLDWQPRDTPVENRRLAAMPARPHDWTSLITFPAGVSAYVEDHYGLRSTLVELNGRLRYGLFGEFVSGQVWLGRHDRLFFISHTTTEPFSLMDRICGAGITPAKLAAAASGMDALLREGMRLTPAAYYVSVPTSPVIDAQDLPHWLAQRCANSDGPLVPRLQATLAILAPDIATRLVYPRAALDAAKTGGAPYPEWNFHWSGVGAAPVVDLIGRDLLHLPRSAPLPIRLVAEVSDLAQFTPGLQHRDMVPTPDHAAAGISFCYGGGGACSTRLASFAHVINEITRSSRQGGPTLLVISDSFGRLPAEYFGAYFGQMLHLNIGFERLTPGELPQLAGQIAAEIGKPDVLLFIYHDAAVIDAGGLAAPFAAIVDAFRKPLIPPVAVPR